MIDRNLAEWMTDEPDARPCPFCGADIDFECWRLNKLYFIVCEYCDSTGPGCDNVAEALNSWNERTTDEVETPPAKGDA